MISLHIYLTSDYVSGFSSLFTNIASTLDNIKTDLVSISAIIYGVILVYHLICMMIASNEQKADRHFDVIKRSTVALIAVICSTLLVTTIKNVAEAAAGTKTAYMSYGFLPAA